MCQPLVTDHWVWVRVLLEISSCSSLVWPTRHVPKSRDSLLSSNWGIVRVACRGTCWKRQIDMNYRNWLMQNMAKEFKTHTHFIKQENLTTCLQAYSGECRLEGVIHLSKKYWTSDTLIKITPLTCYFNLILPDLVLYCELNSHMIRQMDSLACKHKDLLFMSIKRCCESITFSKAWLGWTKNWKCRQKLLTSTSDKANTLYVSLPLYNVWQTLSLKAQTSTCYLDSSIVKFYSEVVLNVYHPACLRDHTVIQVVIWNLPKKACGCLEGYLYLQTL